MEDKKKVIGNETKKINNLEIAKEEYINLLSNTTEETYEEELIDQVEAAREKNLYEEEEKRFNDIDNFT